MKYDTHAHAMVSRFRMGLGTYATTNQHDGVFSYQGGESHGGIQRTLLGSTDRQ